MIELFISLTALLLLAGTIIGVARRYRPEFEISEITGEPVEMADLKFYA